MTTERQGFEGPPLPSGPSQRRRRLSDEETGRRMLDAALAMVARSGLTVGLDHIGFEDIIREAGVARTAVYRRWPYKDLFISDLLRALAADVKPVAEMTDQASRELLGAALDRHAGTLHTEEGRRNLIAEMMRLAAASDLQAATDSVEWRTYLALQSTFLSLPDGELRDDIQAGLDRAERGFVERVARNWERLAGLLGLRIRPGSGGSFELVATLASATTRGLVLMSLTSPELTTRRHQANPTAASASADWSLLGMAAAGIAATFLEPDPGVVWDEKRLEGLRSMLGGELTRVALVDPGKGS